MRRFIPILSILALAGCQDVAGPDLREPPLAEAAAPAASSSAARIVGLVEGVPTSQSSSGQANLYYQVGDTGEQTATGLGGTKVTCYNAPFVEGGYEYTITCNYVVASRQGSGVVTVPTTVCTAAGCEYNTSFGGLPADQVILNYSVSRVAPPAAVSIDGPGFIQIDGYASWQANASGGTGSYTYSWDYSTDGVSWSPIAGATGSTCTRLLGTWDSDFHLRVTVVSGNRTAQSTRFVNLDQPLEPRLTAYVTGTGDVRLPSAGSSGTYTWTANTNGGGTQPLTYEWDVAYPDHGSGWTRVGGNDPSLDLVLYGSDGRVDVRVTVRSASGKQSPVASYTTWVTTEAACGSQRYCY